MPRHLRRPGPPLGEAVGDRDPGERHGEDGGGVIEEVRSDEGQAQRFLAKLSLILANQIGDSALLREAIDLAREPETSTLTSNESAP